MKIIVCFLLSLFFLLPIKSYADLPLGAGVLLGSPTGATARYWLNDEHSIDMAAGWTVFGASKFHLHADFLFSRNGMLEVKGEPFDLYFGAGLGLRSKSGRADGELVFGPRVPVGVSYEFEEPNLEVFAQGAVNLGVIPSTDFYVDAGVGVRFYVF
ncbi:MAG: hypothetical protein M9962_04040 [Oligoflexia bacterium]|nr:hypothetical protein [Oligoflexia bacterium]